MKIASLTLAATLLAGTAFAQSTAPTPGNTAPGATSVTPMPGVNPSTGTTPETGVVGRNTGPAAASGDRNQAVATTSEDALEPASGATSFTEGQARGRIESQGYTAVTALTKDDNGVWRGTATKDGSSAQVWMDYKGNVGQQGGVRPAATTGTTATGTTATGTNPPGTAAGRAVDQATGSNTTGTNPGATNPPGTAAGRATDRALGTNATGTNPAATPGSTTTPR